MVIYYRPKTQYFKSYEHFTQGFLQGPFGGSKLPHFLNNSSGFVIQMSVLNEKMMRHT